jgi:hypothetical protein
MEQKKRSHVVFEIVGISEEKSREKETPALVLDLASVRGIVSRWWGWTTPEAGPYTGQTLKRLGWDGETLESLGSLIGVRCIATVEEDTRGGRVEIKGLWPMAVKVSPSADLLRVLNNPPKER